LLQFNDESLARLIRATAKISHRKRGRFLRRLAHDWDPSPNALRLRKARQRQNHGVKYFRLVLNELAVEELLIREQRLLPGRDYSRAEVESQLARFIDDLCKFDMHVGEHD
jgi:hypothetical protein